MKSPVLVHDGQESLFFDEVNLVDDEKGNSPSPLQRPHHPSVLLQMRRGGVDQKETDIHVPSRFNGCGNHPLIQFRFSLMDPRRIEKDQLPSFQVPDAENTVPRGLGLFRDNGNLFFQDGVEKGRFPSVGSSEDSNVTGLVGNHGFNHSN